MIPRRVTWERAVTDALISYEGYGIKRRVFAKRLGRWGGWTWTTERV